MLRRILKCCGVYWMYTRRGVCRCGVCSSSTEGHIKSTISIEVESLCSTKTQTLARRQVVQSSDERDTEMKSVFKIHKTTPNCCTSYYTLLDIILRLCSFLQKADKGFDARIRAWVVVGRSEVFELDATREVLGAAMAMDAEQALLASRIWRGDDAIAASEHLRCEHVLED